MIIGVYGELITVWLLIGLVCFSLFNFCCSCVVCLTFRLITFDSLSFVLAVS